MKKLKQEIATSILKQNLINEYKSLTKYACKSSVGSRMFPEREDVPDRENIRPTFFRDTDKIIHSGAYSRYIDKTQVFYLIENDHITHRVLHVQLVSKIGRVLGRSLRLNEDLIEAIALGHDIGHAPFGHNGETYLNELCINSGIGYFVHNAQSVRQLQQLTNKGLGVNLTLQVADGILCHNGEILNRVYKPNPGKKWEDHLSELSKCFSIEKFDKTIVPSTLEACAMRISDQIAYAGRDMEDAIFLNLIKRTQLPESVTSILGNNNKSIVNTLIIDLINNSYGENYLAFSDEVYTAFNQLIEFNSENVYSNPKKKVQDDKICLMFSMLFQKYFHHVSKADEDSEVYKWCKKLDSGKYLQETDPARIVVDYMAGMTDKFILQQYENLVTPETFGLRFKKAEMKRMSQGMAPVLNDVVERIGEKIKDNFEHRDNHQ